MIGKILLLLLVGVVICKDVLDTEITMEFGKFIKAHKKNYNTVEEALKRYQIFSENYRYIVEHNSQGNNFELGVNQFADLTLAEIKQKYLSYKKPAIPCTLKHAKTEAKEEIDWTAKGKVAKVKNQGNCGSCWAFSAIAALEGLQAIKNGKVIEYSEQELVDCTIGWGDNQGCKGGDMSQAFEYIAEKGISLETEYPYEARNRPCRKKSNSFQIKGCVNVTHNDNDELLEALNIGPVSIAVKADNREFMYYRGGIIDKGCGSASDELDHGILLAGAAIDAASKKPYWICKNSWGSSWGKSGYVWIERMKGKGEGRCGIAMEDSYPVA